MLEDYTPHQQKIIKRYYNNQEALQHPSHGLNAPFMMGSRQSLPRGDIQNDDGVFKFMTLTTPNSSAPDVCNWAIPNGDPLMPVNTAGLEYSAARSRHAGGVNAALCDGSVRFFSKDIPLATWQGLGSMNGGEAISDF